ncbi:uncharacterized protein LOC141718279 [Apium graveolens]|uniref:uncharacterized protein LOC141718279 n=1 Tax=Apium graveolens TaxID=4045 RepID=UPI003D798AED
MQSLSSASFNSYSPSNKLSEIADRVVNEFQSTDDFILEYTDYNHDKKFVANNNNNNQQQQDEYEDEENEDEGEFEFPQAPLSPIPADEIFSNGQIRPVYPLFNTELVFGNVPNTNSVILPKPNKSSARLPLGKLFMEERANCSSCSSSESDELDGVPSETYCVWKPNTGDNPRELRTKSSSTGTSKRWKFRALLHKSNSDGNDTFDLLNAKKELEAARKETTAPQQNLTKKGPVKENDVRRSYLPHKKDLVELFFSVNGVSRHVNPY